jgi:hypothetical protein
VWQIFKHHRWQFQDHEIFDEGFWCHEWFIALSHQKPFMIMARAVATAVHSGQNGHTGLGLAHRAWPGRVGLGL